MQIAFLKATSFGADRRLRGSLQGGEVAMESNGDRLISVSRLRGMIDYWRCSACGWYFALARSVPSNDLAAALAVYRAFEGHDCRPCAAADRGSAAQATAAMAR